MRKLNKSLIVLILLSVINGCSTDDPRPEIDFPSVKILPERQSTNIYFEEVDSNKTMKAGSLDTTNGQKLWTMANVYKYDSEFYRNQLITLRDFIHSIQTKPKE